MEEEDEEEEPETCLVALGVRLVDVVELVEVGDALGQAAELHLERKQNHHQAAAKTCGTDRSNCKHPSTTTWKTLSA